MLEDIRRDNEVKFTFKGRVYSGNVQLWVLMVISILVTEFLGQRYGITIPVGHTYAGNFWHYREV